MKRLSTILPAALAVACFGLSTPAARAIDGLTRTGPVAHFSFGLGFLFNAWASVVGAGALAQDVDHRIIPNWAAGSLLLRNKSVEDTLYNPKKMAIAGAIVGAVHVTVLNTTASGVPSAL